MGHIKRARPEEAVLLVSLLPGPGAAEGEMWNGMGIGWKPLNERVSDE